MEPGRRLGEFVLREELGAGAFGVVHRAEQPSLHRDAVVKILHARHHGSARVRRRFEQEARLASMLSHPLAAHIYAFGSEDDGTLWLAMELVRGTPLSVVLQRQGPLPLATFVPLFEQICDVVHAAHELGIVHRDLKPANIMVLERRGRLEPKLLDFGLAHRVDQEGDPQPPGAGSPGYMAPETWKRGGVSDPYTDQYALGVLVYECLTGRPPFAGNLVEVGRAHVSQALPPLGHDLPAALDGVLARATAKAKEARFPSVAAFAAALRAASGIDPPARPARRRAAAAAVIALGLAAGGLALGLARRPRAVPCADADAPLRGVWDDGVRAAMKDAFARTGLSYQADSFARAAGRLDDHARAWSATARAVCEATEVRHAQPASLREVRAACLARRLGALRAVTEMLAGPVTAATVDRAVDAVGGLEGVGRCADETRGEPPPQGRDARAVAVRRALDRSAALLRAGDQNGAVAAVRDVQAEATALGWPPLVAEARLQLGRTLSQAQRDLPEAEAALRQGLGVAAEAHLDAEVALGMASLMWVLYQQRRVDEGLALVGPAEVASARAGRTPMIDAARLFAQAVLLGYKGRVAESDVLLRRVIEIRLREEGPGGLGATQPMQFLATSHARRGEFEAALAMQDQVLRRREEAYGPEHPQVRGALFSRATTYLRMGRPREARADAARALAILERRPEGAHVLNLTTFIMAGTFLAAEAYDEALPWLVRSVEAAEQDTGDPRSLVRALESLAQIQALLGEQAGARASLARLTATEEAAQVPLAERAFSELVRAQVALHAGALDEAEAHARVAHERLAADADVYARVSALKVLAWVLLERGRPRDALPLLREARTLHVDETDLESADLDLRLGQALLALRRAPEAVAVLERALAARARLGAGDPVDEAELRLALAAALRATGGDRERARALTAEARALLGPVARRPRVQDLLTAARRQP